MKLFNVRTAYHSTTQHNLKKFDAFTSKEKALTGEGAQVHGWGLYLQEDKELNKSNYKLSLTKSVVKDNSYTSEACYMTNAFHHICEMSDHNEQEACNYSKELISACTTMSAYAFAKPNELRTMLNNMFGTDSINFIIERERISEFVNTFIITFPKMKQQNKDDLLKAIPQMWQLSFEFKPDYSFIYAHQYTVEIPDDFNIVEENRYLNTEQYEQLGWIDQPKFFAQLFQGVKEVMSKWLSENGYEFEQDFISSMASQITDDAITMNHLFNTPDCEEQIKEDFEGFPSWRKLMDTDLVRILNNYLCEADYTNVYPVKHYDELYSDLAYNLGSQEKASQYMLEHGIDGMHYNGRGDGSCYVIYNCNELKITKEEE